MPALIRRLTPAGLVPVDYTADSLAEAARLEPTDGVYTIASTQQRTRVLLLDAHFDRLEESARREGIPLKLDRQALRAALRQMIDEAGWPDTRFRINIPRATPDQPILTLEPFQPPPPEVYTSGVRCVTVPEGRRDNPAAKTTVWMTRRETLRAWFPPDVYEGLLLSADGHILEGLSSNFYGILGGELRTAGEGVLAGIAQRIVLEIAPAILPVRRDAVHIDDILRLDEAFITSASRGIVPVVEIDQVRIGDGFPGPNTTALRDAYERWVAGHLEAL